MIIADESPSFGESAGRVGLNADVGPSSLPKGATAARRIHWFRSTASQLANSWRFSTQPFVDSASRLYTARADSKVSALILYIGWASVCRLQ